MTYSDSYDEAAYQQFQGSGMEFHYRNHRLSKSKTIFADAIRAIGPGKRGSGDIPLFVCCGVCNVYMDFVDGDGELPLDGRWICPGCGTRVRETTVYNQIDREVTAENRRLQSGRCDWDD